jgi:hypothetical protein
VAAVIGDRSLTQLNQQNQVVAGREVAAVVPLILAISLK